MISQNVGPVFIFSPHKLYLSIALVVPRLTFDPCGFRPYAMQFFITSAASINSWWLPCGALSKNVLTGLRLASNVTTMLAGPF
jgi:hypothetical protein